MMRQKRWWISLVFLGVFLSVGSRVCVADGEQADADTVTLPPLSYSIGQKQDSVRFAVALQSFFAGLDSLRAGKDTVLTVVHLGDSHIQAGYYSGKMMRLMQAEFGNAGRGWVAPFKLGRLNEPDDYFITSTVREWTMGRSTQVKKRTPLGPGGIGIRSTSPSINLNVYMAPQNGAGYSFNQAIFYRGEKAMPMLPTGRLKDSVGVSLASVPAADGVLADTFRLSFLSDTLLLHSTRRKQGTDQLLPASSFNNVYYGFSLTNGKPGILYHSIGVNGAMYVNYTDETFIRRLALLRPALLIVSLGTNETFGTRFNRAEFGRQARAFVLLVKTYMPDAAVLLTTPPECYRRRYVNKKRTYVRNANTQLAAQTLVEVAREEGLACWDLFAATGGKGSCVDWQEEKLMRKDRIHFTKEGYREQGTLLYRALMQTYNKHLIKDNGLLKIERLQLPVPRIRIDTSIVRCQLSVVNYQLSKDE